MSSTLKLSPNEVQQLRDAAEQKQRLERLRQVREQQRQLSRQRRTKYQQSYKEHLQQTLVELQNDWIEKRQSELANLENRFQAQLNQVGKSYESAQQHETEIARQQQETVEKLRHEFIREDDRFRQALDQFRDERHQSVAEQLEYVDHLQQVRQAESEYAHQLAENYRIEHPEGEIPAHTEIPSSTTLHQMNLNALRQNDGIKFDSTYHHRNYAAVSVQSIKRMDGQTNSAKEAAELRRRQYLDQLRQRQVTNERRKMETEQRFRHALHDVHMEQDKHILEKELNVWQVADRRRKQALALQKDEEHPSIPSSAASVLTSASIIRDRKDAFLSKFFENKFDDVIMTRVRHGSLRQEGLSEEQNSQGTRRSSPSLKLRMFD